MKKLLSLVLLACAPAPFDAPRASRPITPSGHLPAMTCRTDVPEPTRLFVTTTDFSSGGAAVVQTAHRTIDKDLAIVSTDAVPYYHDGHLYVVNRGGFDSIQVFDATAFAPTAEVAIPGDAMANPHSLAFAAGRAFLSLHAQPKVLIAELNPFALAGEIDLAEFADADGNPEASLTFACGDTVFVGALRLDPTYARVDNDLLIAIDARTARVLGSEPLLGAWARAVREDPEHDDAVLLMTSGIERYTPGSGSQWAIPASVFEAEGIGYMQLLAFDTHGTDVYIAAATEDWTQTRIWQGNLQRPDHLTQLVGGLNAVERTLEVVGAELWFGSTRLGSEGMLLFDLSVHPPAQMQTARDTGLPPYSMIALP
jgi:hypothetical protein